MRNSSSENTSSAQASKNRVIHFNKVESKSLFCSNEIITTKYTLLSWAPKSLLTQFLRAANIYFLVISILTCMSFSPKKPFSIIFTFVMVLFFTMIKEGVEDYYRHKQDNQENNRLAHRVDPVNKELLDLPSKDVKVGDIIRVQENEQIPADIVMISSSDAKGIAFINTMNLDGETNLKDKMASESTRDKNDPITLAAYQGKISCDLPNENLNSWKCTLEDAHGTRPLGMKQLLLRGCVVKNTDYVYGVVVYTGTDTKIVLNSKPAPRKVSNVLKLMNFILFSIFGLQIVVCVLFSFFGIYWNNEVGVNHTYINLHEKNYLLDFFIGVGTFMVAYSSLIPISLYVSLEMVKIGLAYFMNHDLDMYYEEEDKPANCRTSDLVEELGQVEFVFTDKTGTLTCNIMEFKKCSIGGSIYGGGKRSNVIGVGEDTRPAEIMKDLHHPEHGKVKDFFNLMAVCHSVFPNDDPKDKSKKKYQAASPDELALVDGSADMDFIFWQREDGLVRVKHQGHLKTWLILAEIPYSSERKRMSLIVKDPESHKTVLLMKGADSVMIPLLKKSDSILVLEEHLRQFAVEGLRTLVMAKRTIKDDVYTEWKQKWDELALSLDEDKDKKLEEHGALLEKRLTLVGASAIEDRLQDGVPDAIRFLMNAHIRVWMLTGDKQETAIEIGKSCNLIQTFHTLVDLSSKGDEEFSSLLGYNVLKYGLTLKSIPEIIEMRKTLSERMAIVIDGSTLAMALARHQKNFFKLGLLADSCICCRVSPAQKAQVVELAKSHGNWITLAIGDGANDVNMIQSAHIGVGIIGKEGAQAVQSSDYALAQFKYLQKLLLVHGRWGYRRISLFICYYFYKNVAVVFCELCYAFFNGFSGQIFVLDTLTMMFNAVWTSWPCMLTFILEQDLNAEESFKHPIAYKAGQLRQYFSMKVFWGWMIAAMWHGSVSLFLPFVAMAYAVDDDGRDTGLWWVSTLSFTLIIHIISFKMLMVSSYWNKLSLIGVIGGLGLYYVSIIFLNTANVASRIQPGLNQLFYALMSRPKSWIVVFFVPIIALIPDFVFTSWNKIFHPTPVDNLMAIKRMQEDLKKSETKS